MLSQLYFWFVAVTIIGTLSILAFLGVPLRRLFEAESKSWAAARLVAVSLPVVGAVIDLAFAPRPLGEALINWAFFPFGAWLWARCIYLAVPRWRPRA
jgi:hypothetical protein